MIRGPLRSAIHRAVGSVRLIKRLPPTFGRRPVVVTPRAYLRYWTATLGTVHADLLAVIDQSLAAGDCFWDIGANVGAIAFAAAQRTGPGGLVLAIEPDVDVCGLLHRSRRLAGPDEAPVDVLPIAVADVVGISRFDVSAHGSTTSSLAGYGRFPGVRATRVVPTFTLDWLLDHFRPPDVIKVDVEGAELLVLAGGSKLFEGPRPLLICEVGCDVAAAVTDMLQTRDYKMFDARLSLEERIECRIAPSELFAIPAEKVAEVDIGNASSDIQLGH